MYRLRIAFLSAGLFGMSGCYYIMAQEQTPGLTGIPPVDSLKIQHSPALPPALLERYRFYAAPTTEWTLHKTADGSHPDGMEQQMVWLMNRARSNPPQEGYWLATMTDPQIVGPRNYFEVNTTILQQEFNSCPAKPPAAFDVRLYHAAKAHSDDLIARDTQDHEGQAARVTAAGFDFTFLRMNVFGYVTSGIHVHGAWNIDWGPTSDGMQNPRDHRKAVMSIDGDLTNVGLAVVPDNNPATSLGPYVVTGNFAHADAVANHYNTFLVGTVWMDSNFNGMYDPGEGYGGVTVTPDKGIFYAVTSLSGGYSIPLTTPGVYQVSFSGPKPITKSVTVNQSSVLVDYLVEPSKLFLPITQRN